MTAPNWASPLVGGGQYGLDKPLVDFLRALSPSADVSAQLLAIDTRVSALENGGLVSYHGAAGQIEIFGTGQIGLALVANSGVGALLGLTRDNYGRITGTTDATITGTANRISVADGDAVAGPPTVDIAATYVGQASITTLGTVVTGTWNATVVAPAYGGTGISSYTTGDLLYASDATTLAKLAAGTATHVLTSNGAGAAPSWQAPSSGYTDEQAQDAAAALFTPDDGDLDYTYNDGTPSITSTVKNDAITYAKIQNVSAASKLLGRGSGGGSGNVEEVTLGTGLSMSGTTLSSDVSGTNLDMTTLPHAVQPYINRGAVTLQWHDWQLATATNAGNPGLTTVGALAAVTAASPSHSPHDLTKTIRRQPRRRWTSNAAAGSSCGPRNSDAYFSGDGGYEWCVRWGPNDPATVANARSFVGVRSGTGAIANADPSTLINCFGVGNDSGEANLSLLHNDGSGSCTKVPLGANFPASSIDTDWYELSIRCAPGGGTIQWYLRNVTTGNTTSGSVSSDIPASNTGLGHVAWRNNGSTALAVEVHVGSMQVVVCLE